MLRSLDIVMIGLVLVGAAFTYKIKHDSEVAIDRVAKLERQIKAEREAIDVLLADWSLLSRPERLESLVKKHRDRLELYEVQSTQIGSLDQVPVRIELPGTPADTGVAGLLKGEDQITTGTIDRDGAQ